MYMLIHDISKARWGSAFALSNSGLHWFRVTLWDVNSLALADFVAG